MVLPNKWEESEMILSGKNQHDSFIGWEEPKWFFQVMGRTKMVLPWNGKNQNGSSTGWEEPKNQRTKDDSSYTGKNHNDSSIKNGMTKVVLPNKCEK